LSSAIEQISQPFTPPANAESIGLNVRPEPTVVIKLQYHVSQLGSESSPQPYRGTLKRILTELAVAFGSARIRDAVGSQLPARSG